jgi:hypothetical protein
MNPPNVYDVTRPKAHSTRRMTAIVHSMRTIWGVSLRGQVATSALVQNGRLSSVLVVLVRKA